MPAMDTVIGIGPMQRRLQLTPIADPTPPRMTAATTCRHTGETGTSAFWSVLKTDLCLALRSSPGRQFFVRMQSLRQSRFRDLTLVELNYTV
jgi:hypothetical protein